MITLMGLSNSQWKSEEQMCMEIEDISSDNNYCIIKGIMEKDITSPQLKVLN